MRIDYAEHVPLAHPRARRPSDVDLPLAALDGHRAQVLGGGLRAVARASGGGELHLVWRLDALEAFLDGDAERGRVPHAVAAEVGADARLAGAEGFRVRVPRGDPQVAPHFGQFLLGDAEQVDALAAGDLHHRHLVALGHLCDALQLGRRGDSAVDARHDAERAVLLDVGVHAVVDEAGVALVVVLLAPEGLEERGEADLAWRVLATVGQRGENRRDAAQAAQLDFADQVGLGERHARHVPVHRRILDGRIARAAFEECLDVLLARAAAGAGAGGVAERLERALSAADGSEDLALGDAVAVADLRFVRRLQDTLRSGRLRRRKEEPGRIVGESCAAIEGVQEARRRLGLAEQDGARQLPLADDQLLVHAALLVDVFDLLVLLGDRIARAHHREVDAHYF